MGSLLFQAFASANVKDSDREKQRCGSDKNDIQHDSFPLHSQSFGCGISQQLKIEMPQPVL